VCVGVLVVAGSSATASQGAMLKPAAGDAGSATGARSLTVTLHTRVIACMPRRTRPGRTTIVVRNARGGVESFVLARHAGGPESLPRFYGVPFVPAYEVVARLHGIRPGAEQRVTVTLARGSYLLVATANASGVVFADEVTPLHVR
jgi:hypothetical protein